MVYQPLFSGTIAAPFMLVKSVLPMSTSQVRHLMLLDVTSRCSILTPISSIAFNEGGSLPSPRANAFKCTSQTFKSEIQVKPYQIAFTGSCICACNLVCHFICTVCLYNGCRNYNLFACDHRYNCTMLINCQL